MNLPRQQCKKRCVCCKTATVKISDCAMPFRQVSINSSEVKALSTMMWNWTRYSNRLIASTKRGSHGSRPTIHEAIYNTLSPLVHSDLAEIFDYIAQHNRAAARRLMERLHERFRMLAATPLTGEFRADLADLIPGVRSVTVHSHVIYFRPAAGGVEIARVLHGARDPRMTLESRPTST